MPMWFIHQERRRPGLEPVRPELAAVEQQQHVERIVYPLLAAPAVTIVPLTDPLAVETRQFRSEYGV